MAVLVDAAPDPTPMEKKTMMMGSPRGVRPCSERPWRWVKTLFFLATMLASLLLDCAPSLLVVVLDLLLPPALLSAAAASNSSSSTTLSQQLKGFRFESSLIDIPIVSAARSLIILCAFLVCDGIPGVYVAITTFCSSASVAYVLAKLFAMNSAAAAATAASSSPRRAAGDGKDAATAVEALFWASVGMAIAHVVAAYRTSCRERRKLLVYRIDVEAMLTLNSREWRNHREDFFDY